MKWTVKAQTVQRFDLEAPNEITIIEIANSTGAWEITWRGELTGAVLRNLFKQAIYKINEVDGA